MSTGFLPLSNVKDKYTQLCPQNNPCTARYNTISRSSDADTDLDVELKILIHLVNVGKYISNDTWDDTLEMWICQHTLSST